MNTNQCTNNKEVQAATKMVHGLKTWSSFVEHKPLSQDVLQIPCFFLSQSRKQSPSLAFKSMYLNAEFLGFVDTH